MMKRNLFILSVLIFCAGAAYTQETEGQQEQVVSVQPEVPAETISAKPENPNDRFHFQMFGGIAINQVTRIQEESGRSNFIWNDAMLGAFLTTRTKNLKPLDFSLRLQGLYPFHHQFNGMEQFAKQTILYAFDIFTGPYFEYDLFKYMKLDITPGVHVMYQLSDEYHLWYMGAGVCTGFTFPVSKRWTILLDGTFTYNNANLGSNKKVQPFDESWLWETSLGFRYTRKYLNFRQ